MAADKEARLSIVIRTVDKATARINAIAAKLGALTKPFRDFGDALTELREKSGIDDVIGGFKGVGSAIGDILGKLLVVGGAIAAATAGMLSLVDHFDELGDKAEAIGVGVDFLAQMRYAAERSGASVESLDSGLQSFAKSLGQARAGTGRMAAFLAKVSPALLSQLKAAKGNEEAFNLLAGAMGKLEDPAKKAALAQATLGDTALAPLFAKGPKGIQELRDRYLELAGSQEAAAGEAGKTDDAMKDLKASTDGVKAALVEGLAPALTVIITRMREWFTAHREDVKTWAIALGKRIPAAFSALVRAVSAVVDTIRPFVDSTTKLKIIAVALAGVIVGPLISSIYALGVALLTTPVGWIVAGIAAIAAGAYLLIDNWDAVSGFFSDLWETVTGGFTWAKTIIKLAIAPILGFPAMIIAAWDAIGGFFEGLWGGIVGVFESAWGIIKEIVDKVVGAVEAVTDAVGFLGESVNPLDMIKAAGGDVGPQSNAAIAAFRGGIESTAKVTVDFANAPRGTRVRTDPQSTADIDLSVGYQLLPGGL